MNDVHDRGPGDSEAAGRDRGVRRARRLRNSVVATGVAGSIGLAGVAAVTTLAGGTPGAAPSVGSSSSTHVAQPQTHPRQTTQLSAGEGDGEGWLEQDDDGGVVAQQPLQPLFQQPQPPASGGGALPHAASSGS